MTNTTCAASRKRLIFKYLLSYALFSPTCWSFVISLIHNLCSTALKFTYVYRGSTQSDGEVLAYYDLHDRLAILQYDLPTRIVPPAQGRPDSTSIPIDHEWHSRKGTELYQRLNQQQQSAADCILASLDSARCKMHYVDGPGGSGKNFSTTQFFVKGQRKQAICVAWTGIAASLLPEGRTASSTFKLNMQSGNQDCMPRR
ncbi:hypothetical protein Aduo_015475 [Ancylostoma duodenale]